MQVTEREAAGPGLEGGPAPPEAQLESPAPPKSPAFDLFSLVLCSKRLEMYLEPLQDAWEGIRFLLRWQMPLCSLLTCLGLNFLLLTLTAGEGLPGTGGQEPRAPAAWFSLCALLVLLPALLGYLRETCRARRPAAELVRQRYHSVRREDLQQVRLARHEAVAEVKRLFYGALLGSLCVLYLLPLCWVLALLNSSLFLGNAEFYRVLLELKAMVEQRLGPKPVTSAPEPAEPDAGGEEVGGTLVDRTPTPTSTEDLTPGSVEEAEEAEPDEEFKDAIEETQALAMEDDDVSQCSAEFDIGLPDSSVMSKNEVIRSKVSRLTERLRKRYPSNNFGSCTGCAATFSVLKKRRSCSNCGNSFCSRCCSYKVPKSSMGATAPDAQRETVFVCASCNQALVK
ncbi:protrudin isoform X5 [Mauremys mutica]|uniref:protrudin isoform X5 n=1 Tax=Mauremys mutica TaxID=74926 RepID=UPI001D164D96|nr:protrudin isoform X5 [Mauremys mutica]